MWDYVKEVNGTVWIRKLRRELVIFGGESSVITPTLTEDLELDDIIGKITESNITSDRTTSQAE